MPLQRCLGKGLSPRVRGNHRRAVVEPGLGGSIPARAGEPCPVPRRPPTAGVYPRACGGTINLEGRFVSDKGLSPRVRGNRCWPRGYRGKDRSIPARAGEPGSPPNARNIHRVYPRACGGTSPPASVTAPLKGLSPRVRGNPVMLNAMAGIAGSIPARAGEPRA